MQLLASDAYREATLEEVLSVSNGCGPDSMKIKCNGMFGVSIYDACLIHDYEYEIGGGKKARRDADLRFVLNVLMLCLKQNRLINVLRVPGCFLFYLAVRFGGHKHFTWIDKDGNEPTGISS